MRGWLAVALVSASAAMLISAPSGAAARTSETKPVPGTAQTHNGVLLDTLFKKGKTYTLRISGEIVVDPFNPRSWDAVYCFKSTNGTPCQPTPYAVCGLQLTWYRGTEYSHWTLFGCPGGGVAPLGYQASHVYTQKIVPPFDARLKVGVGDSVPGDNTGTFTVTVTGPPPAAAKPAECVRTYIVKPSGARIHAQVKNTELSTKQIAAVLEKERAKYADWDYDPIGKATRRANCAGFVMMELFPGQMVDANVNPDVFFTEIVKPFGSKRRSGWPAEGDIAIWRTGTVVQHVGFVESGGNFPRILTKDGDERPYRMTLKGTPSPNDPLAQAHGSIEFWELGSNVEIEVVAGKDCGK